MRKYRNANLNVGQHATYLRLRALKHIWDVDAVRAELEALDELSVQVWLSRSFPDAPLQA